MDQNTPKEHLKEEHLKEDHLKEGSLDRGSITEDGGAPVRVALYVLALCFTLSVLGRGLGESFTVFLKPLSEGFGWDRAEVVSVYSLCALAGGLSAPFIGQL